MIIQVGDPDAHLYNVFIDGKKATLVTMVDSDTLEYAEYDTEISFPPSTVLKKVRYIGIDPFRFRIDITSNEN
jgi:endonuclease YncB( thermonuclease family)